MCFATGSRPASLSDHESVVSRVGVINLVISRGTFDGISRLRGPSRSKKGAPGVKNLSKKMPDAVETDRRTGWTLIYKGEILTACFDGVDES